MLQALILASVIAATPVPCTDAFPFSEGSPWRALDTSVEELTDALWLIDEDENLELVDVFAEAPGCFVVIFKVKEEWLADRR
jgi:hypothetical protein